MLQRREQLCDAIVAGPVLDADRALSGCGNECRRVQRRAAVHFLEKADPLHSGDGEYGGIESAVKHRAHARVDVAAQFADLEVRPRPEQLRATAKRTRADHCAPRQRFDGRKAILSRDQRVARIAALDGDARIDARTSFSRQVFERMYGDVGAILEQRLFQFLDEHAVAADRRDAPVSHRVAFRRDLDEHVRRALDAREQRRYEVGLSEREPAFTRGDAQGGGIRCRHGRRLPFARGSSGSHAREREGGEAMRLSQLPSA
jgi:hypothetical protein